MVSIQTTGLQAYFRAITEKLGPPAGVALVMDASSAEDAPECLQQPLPKNDYEPTEGQSFVITYLDSGGALSTRSISVWAVRSTDGGIPVLIAKCHLRKATRTFRVDRIESIADHDGVLIEPMDEFLKETFGIEWTPAKVERSQTDIEREWQKVRRTCRHSGVQLLCAVALADGELIPDETGEILDFLRRKCAEQRIEISPYIETYLRNYVRRLRPTPETTERAIDDLHTASAKRVCDLLSACVRVMEADGIRHPNERKIIEAAALELTGVALSL
jgi:tellurite resistance protein